VSRRWHARFTLEDQEGGVMPVLRKPRAAVHCNSHHSATIESLEARTLLTSVVVNSTIDGVHLRRDVTLRQAILEANASTTPTTISFDQTVFATPKTIVLNGAQLELTNSAHPTTITGPAAGVTASGNSLSRVFQVDSNVTLTMSNFTITKGKTTGSGDWGAGINNDGILKLTNVTISSNKAAYVGGGIYNALVPSAGKVTLNDVTFANNTSAVEGGGFFNDGNAVMTNVTFSGNSASQGGGIYSNFHPSLTLALNNVTISANTAVSNGGGIANVGAAAQVTLANTIVAGNKVTGVGAAGPDAFGPFQSRGFNLIGKKDASTGWVSSDRTGTIASPLNALLGALAGNGGLTQTLLPQTGSPAINHGSNSLIPSGTNSDQRGLARIVSGTVDIGAVEVQPPSSTLSGVVFSDTNANGLQNTGELGLANVRVYIDANKNGAFDSGETSVLSNSSGNYKFTALAAGTYRIREVVPPSYKQTAPASGFVDITISAGQTLSVPSFADALGTASISGRVFNDGNGNAKRDSGEAGLGLLTVYLDVNKNGKLDAGDVSTTTDVFGNWSFAGLTAGSYAVRIAPLTGLTTTTPAGGVFSITLIAAQTVSGKLFGEKATN
jgi:hypothetical protein